MNEEGTLRAIAMVEVADEPDVPVPSLPGVVLLVVESIEPEGALVELEAKDPDAPPQALRRTQRLVTAQARPAR